MKKQTLRIPYALLLVVLASGCGDDGDGGACSDACAEGETQCGEVNGVPGFTTCEPRPGGCLGFGPTQLCSAGQSCVEGACTTGGGECLGGCTIGSSQCSADGGVQVCADLDADGCGEYGTPAQCEGGTLCTHGSCTGTNNACTDECPVAGHGCDGADTVVHCTEGDDGCLHLATVSCEGNQLCQRGECLSECAETCDEGSLHCATAGPEICSDGDGDGCLSWTELPACALGERCDNGTCIDETIACTDRCTAGAGECPTAGTARQCGNYDSDTCLEWSDTETCAANEACQSGACVTVCDDECTFGEADCDASGRPIYCSDSDDDPCMDLTTGSPCAAGEVCDTGICVLTCAQDCPSQGATGCEGGQVVVCGDYDADACLEWGGATSCAADQVCSEGSCACTDSCAGGPECGPTGELRTCTDSDGDGCNEWVSALCPADNVCIAGACEPDPCAGGCDTFGALTCISGGRLQTCADYDGDGCLEWGDTHTCPLSGQTCDGGTCVFSCTGSTPCAGEVVFTEFQPNPSAVPDADGEYIELYNATDRTLSLDGCTLSDDGSSHTLGSLSMSPGSYAVIGRSEAYSSNGGMTVNYLLPGSVVGLRNTGEEFVNLSCNGGTIAEIDFGWWVAGGAGVSMQLHVDRLDEVSNDLSYNWCDTEAEYGWGDLGTPGTANERCYGQVLFEDNLEFSAYVSPFWTFGHPLATECEWEWGEPQDQGFFTSPRCTQEEGTHCLGTDLDLWHSDQMDYNNNWVQLGPLDLSPVGAGSPLQLHVDIYYGIHESEEDDHGQVVISTDGQTFSPLHFATHPYSHPSGDPSQWSDSIAWDHGVADLSAYSGLGSVWIRFQMETDRNLLGAGFYIDNVRVVVP